MGLRFHKSITIAPGVKLNINKGSVGISVGKKGAHVSMNSKGQKNVTVGIPGTGLSYTQSLNKKKKTTKDSSTAAKSTTKSSSTKSTSSKPKTTTAKKTTTKKTTTKKES